MFRSVCSYVCVCVYLNKSMPVTTAQIILCTLEAAMRQRWGSDEASKRVKGAPVTHTTACSGVLHTFPWNEENPFGNLGKYLCEWKMCARNKLTSEDRQRWRVCPDALRRSSTLHRCGWRKRVRNGRRWITTVCLFYYDGFLSSNRGLWYLALDTFSTFRF